MAEEKTKRPVGRPTRYKPEFCELIIELAKQGSGWSEWAIACGVDRATLYYWGEEHPEFLTALSCAKIHEQAWWEREGRSGMRADKFNALVWKTSMQARFSEDYTERKETAVTGADGGAIKMETAHKIDADQLEPEQRDVLKSIFLSAIKNADK